MNLKLTVYLKDGRTLSGTYPYLTAMAREEFARTLPGYENSKWEESGQ